MKFLLTFILCLLGVSALGQGPVLRGPYTTNVIPRLEVVNPATRNLTNIAWQNNMEVQLTDGTNAISTVLGDGEADDAHMQITAKTNITIRGLGLNSVIWSGSTGTFFRIAHSQKLTFENLTIEGTRAPTAALGSMPILFGAFLLTGTNSHITFRNVHFKNLTDHGIVQFSQTFPKNSSYVTVENCIFENVGTTNSAYGCCGIGDGVAVNIVGPNQTIRNNTFINCAHGIEFEGATATTIKNVLIEGNLFIGGLKQSIVDFGADPFTDVMIRGNVFDYDETTYWSSWAYAIQFFRGKRVSIVDNIFHNVEFGIEINAGTNSEQWQVSGNLFNGMRNAAITLGENAGGILRGVRVSNNQFDDIAASGIRIFGGRHMDIDGNSFNRIGTNFALPAIDMLVSSSLTQSNRIVGNRFFIDEVASPTLSTHCLAIAVNVDSTVVERNIFEGYTTAAWSDAGTDSVFRDNWDGNTFLRGDGGGSGDVTAASNFGTDNRIIRSDGTLKGVQGSVLEILDNGDVSGINDLGVDGTLLVIGNGFILGNLEGASLTAGTGGITNNGPYRGMGLQNGFAFWHGTNSGGTGIEAVTSGQTNLLQPNITNPAVGDRLVASSIGTAGGTNLIGMTNLSIEPFTNSYDGAVVRVPANALAKEVQVLVATNDFLLLWTNQVSGKLLSLSIYNNTGSNITFTHHGGVRFMGGASNVVAAGRETAVAAKFIGTNISLSFAPQTN